ncbi:MAG: hypothetical protein PHS44_08180 [Candidatus Dojkabacteria bacterium]|nr:hypothetical protein [Candidatus Dojkabacteria bacterium]
MKKIIITLAGCVGIVLIVAAAVSAIILYSRSKEETEGGNNIAETGSTATNTSQNTASTITTSASLDSLAEDAIRKFFSLINDDKPNEAVLMMTSGLVGTDPVQSNSKMQAYAVTFDEWDSVQVLSIEEYDKENWMMHSRTYKVTVSLEFKDTPEYNLNWDEGENTRWIRLLLVEDEWQIDDIATGP